VISPTPTTQRPARKSYPLDPLRFVEPKHAAAARDYADWLSWLKVANKAPRTQDAYKRTVARLLEAFPDKQFDEFTDGDVLLVLAEFPPKSRIQNKAHLNSFFTWGYKWSRRIPSNPVDFVPPIKYVPPRAYDVFTDAETAALCALPPPDGALMHLLFWCGLRRAEARCLTWKRIDFDRHRVILIDGVKGGKDRPVPLMEHTEQALADLGVLEGLNREDHLWYDRPGSSLAPTVRRSAPIANTSFQRWWETRLGHAGVRYRKPHMARHSYATKLRELGVALEDIQTWLGHESIETTRGTYVHTGTEKSADTLRAIVKASIV
jgi:integrase